jgi:hypothetical protein
MLSKEPLNEQEKRYLNTLKFFMDQTNTSDLKKV